MNAKQEELLRAALEALSKAKGACYALKEASEPGSRLANTAEEAESESRALYRTLRGYLDRKVRP